MHIGPVGEVILHSVAAVGVVSLAVCAPNALQILKPFFKNKKYSPKQAVNRNIESLIKSGLIEKRINEKGTPELVLTRRGKWEAVLRSGVYEKSAKKWDHKWRVVIFDVPNEKSKLRAELTRGMRMYGFFLLQKSVWIYPYPCDEFVKTLQVHLELNDHVVYMIAETFGGDKNIRKHFKL